jgi:hypothetical protein
MTRAGELINEILSETKIIRSAVEANDIDIVLNVVERRQKLIDELAAFAPFDPESQNGKKLKEITEIDDNCREGILKMKDQIQLEQYAVKNEKKQMTKSKRAYDQYQQNIPGQLSGLSIDNKK